MKWLNTNKMTMVVVGIVAAVVLGGGRAKADFTFGEPTNLGPTINSSRGDDGLTISSDGLTMFFGSSRAGSWDIWMASRETTEDAWSTPENLGAPVNSPESGEGYPSISTDGLELYFCSLYWQSQRPGGSGGGDLWVTKRVSGFEPWETPENLGPLVNSTSADSEPSISADGLDLYFSSERPGGEGDMDLYVTTRPTKNDGWCTPVNLGSVVNSSSLDMNPCISADGLALFFRSSRPGGYGSSDIYLTTRASTSDRWEEPVNLGPIINNSASQVAHYVSPDGNTLYLDTGGPSMGSYDFWQVSIIPIVDLNGDGIVDAGDMCTIVDHWGESYSLCDIGPTPLGDGIVDDQDLIVLAEHLFKEVNDPTLVAHWPLDEAEGMVVADGAGGNDGYALGDPVWLHDGGQVNGALQLDGVDDYVVTGAAPNPEGNSYSVLAWMKGGAPGQVVLSQMGMADWLCANPSAGTLMTELTMGGRDGRSLGSEAIITDGSWHRIGFVWDGSYRRLYVDGVIVAEDAQDDLDISVNGLYIGTGKAMEPGTFFSGLIDDIRIYNRVVSP